MSKYKSKTMELEAVLWNGHNKQEIIDLVGEDHVRWEMLDEKIWIAYIIDKGIESMCPTGEYIVKLDDSLYLCQRDTFKNLYELDGDDGHIL